MQDINGNNLAIGDTVEFVGMETNIKDYYSDGIPLEKIIHGSTALGEDYKKNKAKIVDSWNEYLIVRWQNCNGKFLQLGFKGQSLKLINNSKNNMNIKEIFIKLFLSEPEKTFREAEVVNGDGILTSDGQQIFLSWLLKKNGVEFKKEVADEIVKEKNKK